MDEGGFVIDYIMPAGSSLAETNRVVGHVEQILREVPEVESTSRRTGLQLGLAAVTEANTGDILVKLKAKRKRGIDEIIADVRAEIKQQEPALDVEFIQVLQDMIGDLTSAPEPIQIKLFSQDPKLLEEWAPKVADANRQDPRRGRRSERHREHDQRPGGHISGRSERGGARRIHRRRSRARCIGHSGRRTGADAGGRQRSRLHHPGALPGGKPRVARGHAQHAAGQQQRPHGHAGSAGDGVGESGPDRNPPRKPAARCRGDGAPGRPNLGSGMADVQKAVAGLHLPSSIRVEYGGTYQEQQQSFHDLVIVLVLAVLLVFIVLLFEFGTFAAPIAILSSALLSTSGVFIALLVTRTTFNISSFMGMIMVIGIVAKNGILLLDADQKMRVLGLSAEEAMLQAARRRLRPIVMTALATVAGMLPLAFALGAGSQMLQPLAIAVIGGVLISMVLSLIITPAVHFYLSGKDDSLEGQSAAASE